MRASCAASSIGISLPVEGIGERRGGGGGRGGGGERECVCVSARVRHCTSMLTEKTVTHEIDTCIPQCVDV